MINVGREAAKRLIGKGRDEIAVPRLFSTFSRIGKTSKPVTEGTPSESA
jgi:hypothetical protein